ncbi:MAG: undecaprenyldiphospho-muramoylpentapeptide beta-N-acetylglucosaminyltransferase [Bacilli bacterium]
MKIIISAGGTGGHIYPALAIIKKFQEKEKNLEVLYIGTHNRMEKDIVPKMGIKYEELVIYGFSKTKIFRDIKNIFLIKKAKDKCKKIMNEFKPDVVIGVGGYVTYPVIKAADELNIKTVIHEQNSIPGKSNISLCKFVDLICISFLNSKTYFENAKKIVYTGNPCGDNALTVKKISKTSLGFSKSKKLIIIVAGSLGSSTFNDKFKAYLKLVDEENYEILYITGEKFYDEFTKDITYPKNVKIVPFIDNLSGLLSDAYLVISRSGASTISELLALNVPSILIPSPYVANNHQYYNALDLLNLGVSELIEEKNLSAEVIQITVNELINNDKKYQNMVDNLKKLSVKHSSDIIYDEVKGLLK